MANLRARWLRQHLTPQEIKLWVQLCYLKQQGCHFRRQAPIGPIIVDFAEKMRKLVIEVDGSQHGFAGGAAQDRARDIYLRDLGYRVLRFWNVDVDTNMDGVIDAITAALSGPTPHVTLRVTPSPPGGEGSNIEGAHHAQSPHSRRA
jgi:very-short-patch-repair endonuclease